ncbi:phosphate uptake regulator PhoU [Candidatus Woesearchaeota archaeon]|jgi:phosphate uptake regulator|nr:phosphate uptake regulator PhoU [Candidatus Woesearchaeota archaeon]MBT4110926.1 phosphate uptake regulator PhoU [Candidatus Woesearchaeota archaeon]MBT4336562.1 phosphate uptake regulator PhoU [Candidatus Woesearchaeota archaeon]MBT4469689.1 phosphate uptake regulator PhoU [Candidatus Woesearchaeota archaeon]MBT6744051.1 phosphate uptake regulator PhoU [Candidatus Woesearchaeota archaeon]
MDYRKLISFGKSSFIISLPKTWITHNKLKKGDLIYIEESGPNLLLSNHDFAKTNEERSINIDIDGKKWEMIVREVNSAYIQNIRTIVLKGKEIKNKIKELQSMVQNLIALEIMEQTSDSIVAKDFLNMEKVSVEELLRKMDIVTRTMIDECCKIFKEDNYESTNERDKDVNRLYFLIYRAILFNLDKPANALKRFKLTPIDLMYYYSKSFYIEGIADEARRSARFLRTLKISVAEKSRIEELMKQIKQFYLETIKAAYNKDAELALNISNRKKLFNLEIDEIEKKYLAQENFSSAMSRLRRLIGYIHSLGRVIYTTGNYY